MRLLLANEPRAYREVLSVAFKELRPEIEVFTVDSETLDREYLRLLPELVLCSNLTRLIEDEAPAWIELYPDAGPLANTCLHGDRATVPDMDLGKLLSIIDEASGLVRET